MIRPTLALLVLALCLPIAAAPANAPGSIPPPALPDVMVVTQTGSRVPFRDLIADRTVAINFIFTSCPTVCNLMGASFGRIQKLLGGRPVTLVSVSIDPATDTPARLAAWSKRFGASSGWTLVTGSREEITRLLKAFGVFTASPLSHSPTAFVADTRRGLWRKVDGLAPPSTIIEMIDGVRAQGTR